MSNRLTTPKRIIVSAIACCAMNLSSGNPSAIAASLAPSLTPTTLPNQELLLAQARQQVDWTELVEDFTIVSQPKIIMAEQIDPMGKKLKFLAISFIAEAKRSMLAPIYMANFFDSNGVIIWTTPVDMQPNYGDWQPGVRTNCLIILPPEPEKVAAMKISGL